MAEEVGDLIDHRLVAHDERMAVRHDKKILNPGDFRPLDAVLAVVGPRNDAAGNVVAGLKPGDHPEFEMDGAQALDRKSVV